MINEYIRALFFIFIAEMGDKTQILAMMFATKYKMSKVFMGIFIGSLLNHGLAVAFGSLIGSLIQPYIMQVAAGAAFIGFSLWTLAGSDDDEDIDESGKERNAVITVAAAFFIGELGDKTQLTAITLAVDAAYPVLILAGTVSGMVLTSGIGIFAGSKLGDKLPEYLIKLFSGMLFFIFGSMKLAASAPDSWKNPWTYSLFGVITVAAVVLSVVTVYRQVRGRKETAFSRAAENLYRFTHEMETSVDEICLGVNHCGQCAGDQCAVGFIRHMLKDIDTGALSHSHDEMIQQIAFQEKKFSRPKILHAIEMTDNYLEAVEEGTKGYEQVLTIKAVLEKMLEKKDGSSDVRH